MSEGALFRAKLGDSWNNLAPQLRERFDHDPVPGEPTFYHGTMDEISCSWPGRLFAYFTSLFVCALCPHQGKGIRSDIEVYRRAGEDRIYKKRIYRFPHKDWVFDSYMCTDGQGNLWEYVTSRIGMRLNIEGRGDSLFFTDDGYFIELFGKKIFLPLLLSPGRTELIHQNINATTFRIEIIIKHPVFGVMYRQSGVFQHGQA